MNATKETMTSYLDEFAGNGLETIGQNEQALAYLGMVQPGSQAEMDGATAGVWRNSATGEEYGNVLRVIPLAFKTIWSERSSEPPFSTVGRYIPNSIEVRIVPPKPGKRGYPKMINPNTENEIQELYIYAVILPDFPEAGVLLFNPTVGSMKTCKSWNTQLKSQLLPSGASAPIFGYAWHLYADLVQNPQKPSEQIAKFVKVQRDVITSEEIFTETIRPKLTSVNATVLSITDDSADEE